MEKNAQMKMTIGRTLKAKMKPRSGKPVFSPTVSIGPASQPKRKPEPPLAPLPVEDEEAEGHLERERPADRAPANRPPVFRERERDGEHDRQTDQTGESLHESSISRTMNGKNTPNESHSNRAQELERPGEEGEAQRFVISRSGRGNSGRDSGCRPS